MHTDSERLDQLETALEAAGIAWWWMELPSGTVFFSPNKTNMLGRRQEDFFHYKHFVDIVNPDDQARIMKAMQDHLEGKTPLYETVYRIKKKNGKYATFYDRGKIISEKSGEKVVAGIVFDTAVMDDRIQQIAIDELGSS